jgi:hypothetical protein
MGGMKARAPKNHADDWAASRFVEVATRAEKMGEEDARKLWDSLLPDQREYWRGAFLERIEQERDLGRVVMEKMFRIEGREFSTQPLEAALNSLNCATVEELFLAVGQGRVSPNDVLIAAFGVSTNNVSSLMRHRRRVDENKTPGYTGEQQGGTVGDAKHDLNAVAAGLGLSYEEAAQKLTAAARSKKDPLSRARRIVRGFQRRRAKNPDYPVSQDVRDAFSIINKANYPQIKAKRAAEKKAKLAM